VWVFEWYNEGMMYLTGEGFPKNRDKAIELFRRAANQDHPGAKNMLAKLDASDSKEIEDTLNSNNAEKMYQLGEKFRDNCEYEKAEKLFQKASNMGHVGSIFRLAEWARHRDKDYAKALELFTKAAEQGHAEAQNELGDMYFYGHGIPVDKEKAGYWYRKAAPQGIENAQRKIQDGQNACAYLVVSEGGKRPLSQERLRSRSGARNASCNVR
jgi:TPR repeat protein